jgi:hypothetical protein
LVEDVFLSSDAFAGLRRDHLPDVAIAWRPDQPVTEVRSDRLGTLTGRLATGRGGNHRPSAFAAITGPAHTSRRVQSLRTILDLSHFVQQALTNLPSGA